MNILKFLKAKFTLRDEIKKMTMEEKIKEIDEISELLKDIPEDLDEELEKGVIEVLESVYHEALASGVPMKNLSKIKELANIRKTSLKEERKKNNNNESLSELYKLFDE